MRALTVALALCLGGCSLVFDPGNHMGGVVGTDAGAMDAGTDAGEDAGPPTVPLSAICDEFATIYCDAVRNCCGRVPDRATWDDTECRGLARGICSDAYDLVEERSALEYDPAAAWETVETGRGFATSCDLGVQDWYLDREGFLASIVGTIEPGGDCTPRDPRNRDDLTASALSCAGDQRCIMAGMGRWLCGMPAAHGQECTVAFDCVAGSRCTRDGLFARGVCAATGEPAGSQCVAGDECDSFICDGPVLAQTCAARTQDNAYCPAALFGDAMP